MTVNITGALFSFSYANFSDFVLMYRIDFSFLMYFDRTYTHLTFLLDISPPSNPQPPPSPSSPNPPHQYNPQPPHHSAQANQITSTSCKRIITKMYEEKMRWSDDNKTRKREEMPRPRTERTKSEIYLFFPSFLLIFFLIPGFGFFFLIVGGREIRWDWLGGGGGGGFGGWGFFRILGGICGFF